MEVKDELAYTETQLRGDVELAEARAAAAADEVSVSRRSDKRL